MNHITISKHLLNLKELLITVLLHLRWRQSRREGFVRKVGSGKKKNNLLRICL